MSGKKKKMTKNIKQTVYLWVVGELNTRVLALQVVAAWLPGDGGALLHEVDWVKVLGGGLLNQAVNENTVG